MMLSINISAVCKDILPTFILAIGSTICCGGIATETFSVAQVYMVMGISVKHWQIKESTWRFTPLVRSVNILATLCVMVLSFHLHFICVLSIFWLFCFLLVFLCSSPAWSSHHTCLASAASVRPCSSCFFQAYQLLSCSLVSFTHSSLFSLVRVLCCVWLPLPSILN